MLAIHKSTLLICVDNQYFYEDGDIANAILITAFLQKYGACTCLDIGMDKGWWSRWILSKQPDAIVHGFEPNPNSYKKLCDELSTRKGLILHNVAASSQDGHISFRCNGPQSNSRTSEQSEKSIQVPCVRIPDYLPSLGNIGLVKIDTEGHELEVLQGLLPWIEQDKIKMIICEFTTYWHGSTLEEAFEKSEQILDTILQHFPYIYILSRTTEHVFGPINNIRQFISLCFKGKFQVDFVFSSESLESYDIVLAPYQEFVKRFVRTVGFADQA